MISSCDTANEIRRARPALGTFVEIRAVGENGVASVEKAFAAIAEVERLMSFFRLESDVSRMNSATPDDPLDVAPWTWEVLKISQEIAAVSDDLFNITVAPQLQRWGYLPAGRRRSFGKTTCRDYTLLPQNRVVLHRPLQIDLGGIAKGFAVDRAVEALVAADIGQGAVNAGGDLRVFGPQPQPTCLRHPRFLGEFIAGPILRDAALATSATYFSKKRRWFREISPLLHGRTGRPFRNAGSISVVAPSAVLADALTKVCAFAGEAAAPVLARFAATVIPAHAS